ncbi:hypothetical protein [Actinokineospora iranica]|uniref:hypothetical protein n=1 Tax=Actinokineospora iranica TaxID=1271860 RepID=UPI001113599B|nr:hypothetical protein [Actinokineospora iranica]
MTRPPAWTSWSPGGACCDPRDACPRRGAAASGRGAPGTAPSVIQVAAAGPMTARSLFVLRGRTSAAVPVSVPSRL